MIRSITNRLREYLGPIIADLRSAVYDLGDTPRRVILESPYAGNVELNERYARACLRDSLRRGEAPIASHLLYTQPGVLDDQDPNERLLGIEAGLAWGKVADATVVYVDLGVSRGMEYGIEHARRCGRPVERRALPADELAEVWCREEPVDIDLPIPYVLG